jgi:hypothetical protein
MPAKDKPQTDETDPPAANTAVDKNPPQAKQLTQAQLEAVRKKLQKKFH